MDKEMITGLTRRAYVVKCSYTATSIYTLTPARVPQGYTICHTRTRPQAFRIGESKVSTTNQYVAKNLYTHPTRPSQAHPLEFGTRLRVHRYQLL